MPSSHFSYLRETWPNFPTVNISDVKPAENMSLSSFILAGFYEIAEHSTILSSNPVYLAGTEWGVQYRLPLYSRAGAETSRAVGVENRGQNRRAHEEFSTM